MTTGRASGAAGTLAAPEQLQAVVGVPCVVLLSGTLSRLHELVCDNDRKE